MSADNRESGTALVTQPGQAGTLDGVRSLVPLLLLAFPRPCVNVNLLMIEERGAELSICRLVFVTSHALLAGTVINGNRRSFDATIP